MMFLTGNNAKSNKEGYKMASSIPFVHVSVNRFGFNVLDVKINLVNTEEPRKTAVMLVCATCDISQDDKDNIEWLERQYKSLISNQATVKEGHNAFYVDDDLISFRYEVETDR